MNRLFLIALLLCSCVVVAAAQTPLDVKAGQRFTITLKSNPSTGYQWQLAQPLDETKVTFVASSYTRPQTTRIGAAGQSLWVFKAVNKGRTTISLKYVRVWEKDVAPVRTVNFRISIK